ncbi:MAG: endonuclease/exonuclease/phosphatase family protein, partial [Clostridia bacterium]|nr:endonuclease/exonuclease/phosphatase family protein [Clostridia bacterium]
MAEQEKNGKAKETNKKSLAKKIVVWTAAVLGVLILSAVFYFAYVLLSYYRVEDNLELKVEAGGSSGTPQTGATYTLLSYNIGFGAYESDYGFFMDGGKESRAWSFDRLEANMEKIADYILLQNADFVNLQEVDTNGTRTYHYDERAYLTEKLSSYSAVWAQNYDSPYLFYPITKPIGANRSGIMTFSRFTPQSSLRRSLPVESGLRKLLDLDRCYSVTRFALENGKE